MDGEPDDPVATERDRPEDEAGNAPELAKELRPDPAAAPNEDVNVEVRDVAVSLFTIADVRLENV